jgi:hypothetical protein
VIVNRFQIVFGTLGQQDGVSGPGHHATLRLARSWATTSATGLALPASISLLPRARALSKAGVSYASFKLAMS